jgi:hypothetical protein
MTWKRVLTPLHCQVTIDRRGGASMSHRSMALGLRARAMIQTLALAMSLTDSPAVVDEITSPMLTVSGAALRLI